MIWLVLILVIIIIILLIFIVRLKSDIKYISKQIGDSKGQYVNIRMNTLDKDLENLVLSINDLYEINQKINIKTRNREEDLKQNIANISHDLRTPLTSIMGYIQMIKDNSTSIEDKTRYMDIVERRTETLKALITSFYDLSRIESNEYRFDLKALNISKILCETIAMFYNDFCNKNIEPVIDIDENIPLVITDENAVIRIFSNLINNMLEHGENNFKISLKKENDNVITEFSNDAFNLKKEYVEHIFDRFFTGDLNRSNKNTGLGLSITKAFVEQLGHEIKCEFVDGKLSIKVLFKK